MPTRHDIILTISSPFVTHTRQIQMQHGAGEAPAKLRFVKSTGMDQAGDGKRDLELATFVSNHSIILRDDWQHSIVRQVIGQDTCGSSRGQQSRLKFVH